jgi:addiction module HigA family antidote
MIIRKNGAQIRKQYPINKKILNELSQNTLAKAIGVAPSRITDIVNGRRGITADTDLRLTRLFGLSGGYFLRLQEHIKTTLIKNKIKTELKKIVPMKRIA